MSEQKKLLREHLLRLRDEEADLQGASAAVCARLDALPELAVVRTVLGYAATPREVSVDAVLRSLLARDVTVCLPWVDGPDLGVARVRDLDRDVVPGWRGVREPASAEREVVQPSALDAVLVPGVGFDRAGNRLGQGGGHFDRLLARVRLDTVLIGIALDTAIVDAVPVEAHDRRVHVIVTPAGTLRPGAAEL